MAKRRSRISGTTKLRRTLRRIDPEITKEVRTAIQEGAQAIALDAVKFAPVDEGDLVRSIDYKMGRDGMTAVVGPAARAAEIVRTQTGSAFGQTVKRGKNAGKPISLSKKNKELLFEFYKGYWVEFGTKGAPRRNVPPQPARPFMGPAYAMNKDWILGRTQSGVGNALQKAAKGSGND